jgi:GH24 family phage-related lysozyme (muramidase)
VNWPAIKALIESAEGRVPYFYLDSAGFVTVGVGHLVRTVAEALLLPMEPAYHIAGDFEYISNSPKGMAAPMYGYHCRTRMSNADIDKLLESDLQGFVQKIRLRLPEFDTYSDPAQQAIIDMVYVRGAVPSQRHCGDTKQTHSGVVLGRCAQLGGYMNWIKNLIAKVVTFFSNPKAKDALETAAQLAAIAAPIVAQINTLTPNKTMSKCLGAYEKYGVTFLGAATSPDPNAVGNALLNLATNVLQAKLPAEKACTATNVLNTAVQLAVTASKV